MMIIAETAAGHSQNGCNMMAFCQEVQVCIPVALQTLRFQNWLHWNLAKSHLIRKSQSLRRLSPMRGQTCIVCIQIAMRTAAMASLARFGNLVKTHLPEGLNRSTARALRRTGLCLLKKQGCPREPRNKVWPPAGISTICGLGHATIWGLS